MLAHQLRNMLGCNSLNRLPQHPMDEGLNQIAADLHSRSKFSDSTAQLAPFKVQRLSASSRSWTAMLCNDSPPSSPPVFVKFVRKGASDVIRTENARHEYQCLSDASRQLPASSQLSVPEPIALYPELAALATSYCCGPPLTRFLWRSRWPAFLAAGRLECRRLVELCAAWLRTYHRVGSVNANADDLWQKQTSSLAVRLKLVDDANLLSASTVDTLKRRYLESDQLGSFDALQVGMTHHDFGPHNIQVSTGGVCVFDLGDSQADFVDQDLARFSLDLMILGEACVIPAGRRFFHDLQTTFLAAYGLKSPQQPNQLITLNIALGLLFTAGTSLSRQRVGSRWHRHVARVLAKRLTREAEAIDSPRSVLEREALTTS